MIRLYTKYCLYQVKLLFHGLLYKLINEHNVKEPIQSNSLSWWDLDMWFILFFNTSLQVKAFWTWNLHRRTLFFIK